MRVWQPNNNIHTRKVAKNLTTTYCTQKRIVLKNATSQCQALGVADAFLTASGEASRDAARLHTRSLLAQAVQAVSDIELLAEAAARSMGPRSTGGGSGGGGSGLGAVGIAGSGMDSGGTDTLPRRLSAGNPLQTR